MELMVETREKFGSNSSKKFRREGKIPAVIYGQGKPTEHIVLDEQGFRAFLRGHERVVQMKLPKATKNEEFLLKDVQYDFLGEDICHVDFVRFDASTRSVLNIPLEFVGTPEGTKAGGVLETMIKELHVEMSPKDAPESIRIRVMHLKLDDVLKVKDIPLPEGAKLSGHRLEDIVAQVKAVTEEKEPTVAGEVTMPEVIKRKDDKEGEDDDE